MSIHDFAAASCGGICAALAAFGLHRAWILSRFRWRVHTPLPPADAAALPSVTVQLPLYDERNVAARAIRACGDLDYPRDRLEIQVLDDSTDETRSIADREVARLVERGIAARVLRRASRDGFKAGALAAGVREAGGELVAIFDADFVPPRDLLSRLVGAFQDPGIAMVQARWEHLNRDESTFTRAQAALLDGHFVIAQKVRCDDGLFLNFNGTAGVWRKSAIEAAGGWQADTLTEDLDLSYRAQLRGARLAYAAHVAVPAELPGGLDAFRSQQARWTRGGVQVARKLAPRVARARLRTRVKLEALMHFAAHAVHPLVLALGVVMPWAVSRPASIAPPWLAALCAASTLAVVGFLETGQRVLGRPFARRWLDTLAALALGLGMSVTLSRASLAGLLGRTGAFARTPKRGAMPGAPAYRAAPGEPPVIELGLAAWSVYGVANAVASHAWGALPFLALYAAGFGWVGALALREGLARRRTATIAGACETRSTPSASSS